MFVHAYSYACAAQGCINGDLPPSHALLFYFTLQEKNLDEQVAEKNINHPYIAVVTIDFSVNMFLAVEREILCSVDSVFQAVQLLLSAYYVF